MQTRYRNPNFARLKHKDEGHIWAKSGLGRVKVWEDKGPIKSGLRGIGFKGVRVGSGKVRVKGVG